MFLRLAVSPSCTFHLQVHFLSACFSIAQVFPKQRQGLKYGNTMASSHFLVILHIFPVSVFYCIIQCRYHKCKYQLIYNEGAEKQMNSSQFKGWEQWLFMGQQVAVHSIVVCSAFYTQHLTQSPKKQLKTASSYSRLWFMPMENLLLGSSVLSHSSRL